MARSKLELKQRKYKTTRAGSHANRSLDACPVLDYLTLCISRQFALQTSCTYLHPKEVFES